MIVELEGNLDLISIFTEAGRECGFGHLSRCCALYDESVSCGYDARLIVNSSEKLPELSRFTIAANWLNMDVLAPLLNDSDQIIVDSYLADLSIYCEIAAKCPIALYIDDDMRISYPKGIVINPSLYGDRLPYPQAKGVSYFGGADYVILRPEFCLPIVRDNNNDVKCVLITMGGSDLLQLTAPILSAICQRLPLVHKYVVLGSGLADTEEVEEAADANTEIFISLDAMQMREIMLRSDVAITAAGQTIHELLRCGTPMVPVMAADNQKWNIRGLKDLGIQHINALDGSFDAFSIDWGSLIWNAPRLAPFIFEGQKRIVKMLR